MHNQNRTNRTMWIMHMYGYMFVAAIYLAKMSNSGTIVDGLDDTNELAGK